MLTAVRYTPCSTKLRANRLACCMWSALLTLEVLIICRLSRGDWHRASRSLFYAIIGHESDHRIHFGLPTSRSSCVYLLYFGQWFRFEQRHLQKCPWLACTVTANVWRSCFRHVLRNRATTSSSAREHGCASNVNRSAWLSLGYVTCAGGTRYYPQYYYRRGQNLVCRLRLESALSSIWTTPSLGQQSTGKLFLLTTRRSCCRSSTIWSHIDFDGFDIYMNMLERGPSRAA